MGFTRLGIYLKLKVLMLSGADGLGLSTQLISSKKSFSTFFPSVHKLIFRWSFNHREWVLTIWLIQFSLPSCHRRKLIDPISLLEFFFSSSFSVISRFCSFAVLIHKSTSLYRRPHRQWKNSSIRNLWKKKFPYKESATGWNSFASTSKSDLRCIELFPALLSFNCVVILINNFSFAVETFSTHLQSFASAEFSVKAKERERKKENCISFA